MPWSTPAGLEGAQRAAERPALTPSGPLTAKWRCLTVVKGPNAEIADAAVLILLLLPRSRPVALWPGAVVGSEQRPNDRAPARSIAVEADAGAAERAGPAALRNGVDGHFFGFRGVPWSTPAGLEGPLGAAERATVTPSGPLTARRRCLPVVEGVRVPRSPARRCCCCRCYRELPAGTRSAAARQQRSDPPRSRRRAGR